MTKIHVLLASLITIGLLASCGGNSSNSKENGNQMTMTVKTDSKIYLQITGTGKAIIDWGDGSAIDSVMLPSDKLISHNHKYSNTNEYVITLTGDITRFICTSGGLTSIDVSKNIALTELNVCSNELTSLDLSHNTALIDLGCCYNRLTSLDLSHNTALIDLGCYDNQLTSLDLSHNTALIKVDCYENQLTSLNVTGCTVLKRLYCYENKLTSLDVSSCTALENLDGYENQLTSLDLSHNSVLEYLRCDRNKMSATALNAMMTGLHHSDIWGSTMFNINENPGSNDCDRSIAEKKNWIEEGVPDDDYYE